MRKNIKVFIKKNNIKLKHNQLNKRILVIDRAREDAIIANSLSAYIFNKHFSLDSDLLTDLTNNHDYIKLYRSFNIKKIFSLTTSNLNLKKLIFLLKSFFNFLVIMPKVLFLGTDWFINSFKVKEIYFGDIVYDTYLKNKGFLYNNLFNSKFIKILFVFLYKINFIDHVIRNNKYSLVVCNTHVYASNSAITMRLSLKRKINVLMISDFSFRFYNNLNQVYYSHIVIRKKDLEKKIKFYQNWKKKIDFWLNQRFNGKTKERDAVEAFSKKFNIYDFLKKNRINLKKFKRVGFFAPHAFTDSNYAQGNFLFRSYYDQFAKTVEILKKEKKIFWFINPHPSSYWYKEKNIIKNYLKNKISENYIFCPKKINTYDLLKISDIILTGRGTVGLEAACLGKKAILAGPSYYSSLGFTHNARNLNEYKNLILNKNSNYILSKKEISFAKKAFYKIVFEKSYNKSKLFPIAKFIEIDLDKRKMTQKYQRGRSLLDQLNKNISKHTLLKDAFYISLKDFILQNKHLIK